MPPFVGENKGHIGTNIESTPWWNAEGEKRAGSLLHQKSFEKYVLGNAHIECFESVSGIHFYKIFSRLFLFWSHLSGSRRHTLF